MDSNREEAIKAKEMAEKLLIEKDFLGARGLVYKAKSLFPKLEGIQQLLMALEVYIASERKLNGEMEWYGVLGVHSFDEKIIIRKQYHRLALLLHPDKNKIVGAEDAFKIISEAWRLISDKEMRSAYDQRRRSIGIQDYLLGNNKHSTAPPNQDNVPNMDKSSVFMSLRTPPPKNAANASEKGYFSFVMDSKPMQSPNAEFFYNASKKSTIGVSPSSSSLTKPQTESFWTTCDICGMRYEYRIEYLDKRLVCLNCSKPFRAYKTPPPGYSPAHKRSKNPSGHPPSGISIGRGSAKKLKRDAKGNV